MIVTITAHKSVPALAVVAAGPELASEMGRFAFARWQPQHKAFWVEQAHLDTLKRTLERDGHTVVDDRHSDAGEKHTGPLPECRACAAPVTFVLSASLNGCPACGAEWYPVQHLAPGSAGTRVECPACRHRQDFKARFCGNCRAPLPPWPPADVDTHVAVVAKAAARRGVLQEPLPVGACVPEHVAAGVVQNATDIEEEPERERYP